MPSPANRPAPFAIGGWRFLTGAAFWYVLKYGANCPYLDEWDLSRVFTGEVSVWQLVTQPHNEHRYALGQLV